HEPCKMTAKDRESEEAHLSNNIKGADAATSESKPEMDTSSTEVARDRGRNWGWMLSAFICLNILILGCAFVSGGTSSNVKISTPVLQIFIIFLFLLTSIWMVYYIIYNYRGENGVVFKDRHAGPIWLRGGLLLFGILSLIMDIFKIATYVGYLHCDSAVKVAFPVMQLFFVLLQTYFLWMHSKDCVQVQKNLTRCGLMLTLSTNLVVWMTEVTEESLHQTIFPEFPNNVTKLSRRELYIRTASYDDGHCKCIHNSCDNSKDAYYYLYPFNIEYSLFATVMAFVMWNNVGRVVFGSSHHDVRFSLKDVLIGPVLGVLLVVAGIATFSVYEIEMKTNVQDEESYESAVMMHFVMNIVIVIMMSVCIIIGCAIFKLEHRKHVSEKNPARSLDVGLLVGASLGQFIISYFSIIAMVATGAKGHLNRLNLAWGILMVIQLCLQNFFIIEGLHREPFHEVETDTVIANPYVLKSRKEGSKHEQADLDNKSNPDVKTRGHSGTAEHQHKLRWKRRVLREVCAFLLLGNIILWIMPAFGARPQFDHDTEAQFYHSSMWAVIVNVGLPFGIFYRMHSVAGLFEVYLNS
ncbi:proton channel OTOP2-like, partial [Girardinichthys multiradiatus]|uniref:proton channel OTOP2-like n=1 Tax=Girardinichthys multiradiatus TaxID=208333 RepID=UPI001FADD45E